MNIWIQIFVIVLAAAGVTVAVTSTNRVYARRRAQIAANGGRRPGWSGKQTALVVASAVLLIITITFILLSH
jgi:hypothetical protein